MARPQKAGIDYFPLDTDIDQDDKVALIEAKHGLVGFGVIIKLFKKIYSSNGYYYEWTEETQLLFAKKIGMDFETVREIISDAIRWGLFDKDKFDRYKILTSKRIQKTYLQATSKRKEVEIVEEFIVNGVNDVRNRVNTVINSINSGNNPQSKVKESKGKKESGNKKFAADSIELKLSEYLYQKILEKDSNYRKPNLQSWATHIDRLIRLDNRDPKLIRDIIDWAHADSFWQTNILSTKKLRDKFATLYLQSKKQRDMDRAKKADAELERKAYEAQAREYDEPDYRADSDPGKVKPILEQIGKKLGRIN